MRSEVVTDEKNAFLMSWNNSRAHGAGSRNVHMVDYDVALSKAGQIYYIALLGVGLSTLGMVGDLKTDDSWPDVLGLPASDAIMEFDRERIRERNEIADINALYLASEQALSEDWDSPEEDKAWAHL